MSFNRRRRSILEGSCLQLLGVASNHWRGAACSSLGVASNHWRGAACSSLGVASNHWRGAACSSLGVCKQPLEGSCLQLLGGCKQPLEGSCLQLPGRCQQPLEGSCLQLLGVASNHWRGAACSSWALPATIGGELLAVPSHVIRGSFLTLITTEVWSGIGDSTGFKYLLVKGWEFFRVPCANGRKPPWPPDGGSGVEQAKVVADR